MTDGLSLSAIALAVQLKPAYSFAAVSPAFEQLTIDQACSGEGQCVGPALASVANIARSPASSGCAKREGLQELATCIRHHGNSGRGVMQWYDRRIVRETPYITSRM